MYLLFNALSMFVIAFPPRSRNLFISWLQSISAMILEPKKIRSVTVSIFSPSVCHEVMGPDAMILDRNPVIVNILRFPLVIKAEKMENCSDSIEPVV